jgi:hypothetical protein
MCYQDLTAIQYQDREFPVISLSPPPSPPRHRPRHAHRIDVDTLTDRNATVAAITFHEEDWSYTVTGSAKRKPGDKPNANRAEQLAIGRALIQLGKDFVAASGC